MVPRASRPRRPRQCPEVVQPNAWSDPHRRRASGPRSTWPRPRVGTNTSRSRPSPAARVALRRARTGLESKQAGFSDVYHFEIWKIHAPRPTGIFASRARAPGVVSSYAPMISYPMYFCIDVIWLLCIDTDLRTSTGLKSSLPSSLIIPPSLNRQAHRHTPERYTDRSAPESVHAPLTPRHLFFFF